MAERNKAFPEYIRKAFDAFRPPERLTVSEWADKYRILSEKDSAAPGLWRTDRTPYLKEPMDAFNDRAVKDITFVAGTQLGKTVMEQNMIGFAIAQDPGPMLIVYPTDKLAEFTSVNRLQPMLELSKPLRTRWDKQGSERLELRFEQMYIALVGANSPSNLASRPARYVFFDEIDKFPRWSGNEASPIALAEERTKTFWNKKIVKVSSPTLKTGNIWQSWENAGAQYRYFVPCPHCGTYQELVFRQLKWPEGATAEMARYATYYECVRCKEHIDDRHKMQMLRQGEWRRIDDGNGKVQSVAYHLNSIYSPWVTFGDVAAKFLGAKDFPEELMNFINSWLAEPWEDKSSRMKSDVVMEKALPYERGQMPEAAQLLTCGIDVQLDHFWYAVRAWGPHLTSWLVDWGRVETWADIETVINRNYADTNGVIRNVNLACIDSGYNTDDVYNFCAQHMDVLVPTKGSSLPLKSRYNVTILDKRAAGFGLRLYIMDPNQMKNFIASRMAIDAGARGSWNVYRDIEREYADQICAEQRVEQRDKKGRVSVVWEKISSHAANHLLDCETNNTLAAEIMGVRYLMEQEDEPQKETSEEKDDWIGAGEDWL